MYTYTKNNGKLTTNLTKRICVELGGNNVLELDWGCIQKKD